MAVKAIALDHDKVHHQIIGLNRENTNSFLMGDVFTLPRGIMPSLNEGSDIVLLFAEIDENLAKRFPPALRPIKRPAALISVRVPGL